MIFQQMICQVSIYWIIIKDFVALYNDFSFVAPWLHDYIKHNIELWKPLDH